VDVKTKIETEKYFGAYLKQPKGFGRWAFCPSKQWNTPDYLEHCFWFTGTYSEAKKAAIAHFTAKGVLYVVVCS
jgi:hypothetical protein